MPLDESITGFTDCFRLLGYEPCTNANFEFGYQKVAIYAYSNGIVAHMARQHFWGRGWLSKLGNLEDIVHHDLFAIEGSTDPRQEEYGQVAQILKRSWFVAAKRDFFRALWAELKITLKRLTTKGWVRDF